MKFTANDIAEFLNGEVDGDGTVSVNNVSRIDVVASPYIKGSVTYGGIINIVSIKNDLAGIKLPESGIFLNYLFLEGETSINDSYNIPSLSNIPDSRNTLYWNSNLEFDINNSTDLSFITSDSLLAESFFEETSAEESA